MAEHTQARRDRRFPATLADEHVARIAEAGKVPKERLPELRRHLEALIKIEFKPTDAGARELKKVRRLAKAALDGAQPADFARLGEVLARLTPLARESLARHAGPRRHELPTAQELASGHVHHDLTGKVMLLFGILSRLDLKFDRGRGKPTDNFSAMISSLLGHIYWGVTGKMPYRGRGSRWSPFDAFIAATLEIMGWRSADAAAAPKQAREAVQAIQEARKRRLERESASGPADEKSE